MLRGGASNNTVGGFTAGARNVISGNKDSGVAIIGPGSTSNLVQGNFIGTKSNGTDALGNIDAVWLGEGATNNRIGGVTPEARNILSGNVLFGVSINHTGTNRQSGTRQSKLGQMSVGRLRWPTTVVAWFSRKVPVTT